MVKPDVLLEIKHIRKAFAGVVALDDVTFNVRRGEVHIIMGENGAGKSTLCKIITGLYTKDEGELLFEGAPYQPHTIRDAQHKGINMIHQELNLMANRTVAQNIYVGIEPLKSKFLNVIDNRRMNAECKQLLQGLGIDYIEPTTQVKDLSIAQQQMVEVAKALSRKSKLLIMDEPTSSLTNREIENLFALIRRLKAEGVAIIYISHRMQELKQIGDTVTVMRDGRYVGTHTIQEVEMDDLITMMVGRKITHLYNRTFNKPGEVVLETEGLTGRRFRNASLRVCRGEIVGLAGLVGAGRTELAKAIFGCDPIEDGTIRLFGREVEGRRWNPQRAIAASAGLLPEDRKKEGLILPMSVQNNVTQASLNRLFPTGFICPGGERDTAQGFVEQLRVATPSIYQLVANLSGGNQQKVVLAKWLCTQCRFLIFDEPTRGIDIGAKAEIYELMNRLAEEGYAILMISSELNEIINLSDRVYVMKDGEITGELDCRTQTVTQEIIIGLALGKEVTL